MTDFTAKGRIHMIGDLVTKSEKFSYREVVLEIEDGNYKQYPVFQFSQNYADGVDHFRTGQQVKITFSLRGREYNGKYYTTLNAYRIEDDTH